MLAINKARQIERRIADIDFLLECKISSNMRVDLIMERKQLNNELETLSQDKPFAAFVV
jgi:hypothetical protein